MFGQVPIFLLVWANGFLAAGIRNVRLGFSGKRKQLSGLTHQHYFQVHIFEREMESSFPFGSLEKYAIQGQFTSSQGYVCCFINGELWKGKAERLCPGLHIYHESTGRYVCRNEVSTIWANCLVGGVRVESCLNSAQGEPWVTLFSIASFLVNEIWHRQWHRS